MKMKFIKILSTMTLFATPLLTIACSDKIVSDQERANSLMQSLEDFNSETSGDGSGRNIVNFESQANEGEVTIDILASFGIKYELPTEFPFDAKLMYSKTRLNFDFNERVEYVIKFFVKIDNVKSAEIYSANKTLRKMTNDVVNEQKYANYFASENLIATQVNKHNSTKSDMSAHLTQTPVELTSEIATALSLNNNFPEYEEWFTLVYTMKMNTLIVNRNVEYTISVFLREKNPVDVTDALYTQTNFRKSSIIYSSDMYDEETAVTAIDEVYNNLNTLFNTNPVDGETCLTEGGVKKFVIGGNASYPVGGMTWWMDRELFLKHPEPKLAVVTSSNISKYNFQGNVLTKKLWDFDTKELTIKVLMHSMKVNDIKNGVRMAETKMTFTIYALNSQYKKEITIPILSSKSYNYLLGSTAANSQGFNNAAPEKITYHLATAFAADNDEMNLFSKKQNVDLYKVWERKTVKALPEPLPGTSTFGFYDFYDTKDVDDDNDPSTPMIKVTDPDKPKFIQINHDGGKELVEELGLSNEVARKFELLEETMGADYHNYTFGVSFMGNSPSTGYRMMLVFAPVNIKEWMSRPENIHKNVNYEFKSGDMNPQNWKAVDWTLIQRLQWTGIFLKPVDFGM